MQVAKNYFEHNDFMTIDLNQLENRLWATANQMWANTGLKPSEFSNPVLGLIFLRYAEKKFHEAETTLLDKGLDASEIEKFDLGCCRFR